MNFQLDIHKELLTIKEIKFLEKMWRSCARRIILSTTLAGSGHPGGSLSSLHLLIMLYSVIRHKPTNPRWAERDRVVISVGHISPGVYSVLGEFGYFPEERFLLEFRKAGSPFAGHVEQGVPGIEWNTGNLGQGLSAAAAMALASKLRRQDNQVFCLMGDGEQQKGQISEARRFAFKYQLSNLIGIIDRNRLQIGGDTQEVMPQNIRAEYKANGWNVVCLEDGHDMETIFAALRKIKRGEVDNPHLPTAIMARTIMGKGISFMENRSKYHGQALGPEEAQKALNELGFADDVSLWTEKRKKNKILTPSAHYIPPPLSIDSGTPITYDGNKMTDNRSAYGAALLDIAKANNARGSCPKIVGFSCDLEGSVKMDQFRDLCPEAFFEAGIQEHHAASVAGAMSREGFVSFFSTFGVFGVGEAYNQHRLNDINETSLKLVCTHLGLDVGEDGPTHQCIDYIGLLYNLFDFSIFLPADPNQTDRIIRYIAANPGNHFVGMGRSKTPVITNKKHKPFFGPAYKFKPGRADWLREGKDGCILSYGAMIPRALAAVDILQEKYKLSISLLNMVSIKPFDRRSVIKAAQTGVLITVEDHNVHTGLGKIVGDVLAEEGVKVAFTKLGVTGYGASGTSDDLYHMQGLDPASIAKTVQRLIKK